MSKNRKKYGVRFMMKGGYSKNILANMLAVQRNGQSSKVAKKKLQAFNRIRPWNNISKNL